MLDDPCKESTQIESHHSLLHQTATPPDPTLPPKRRHRLRPNETPLDPTLPQKFFIAIVFFFPNHLFFQPCFYQNTRALYKNDRPITKKSPMQVRHQPSSALTFIDDSFHSIGHFFLFSCVIKHVTVERGIPHYPSLYPLSRDLFLHTYINSDTHQLQSVSLFTLFSEHGKSNSFERMASTLDKWQVGVPWPEWTLREEAVNTDHGEWFMGNMSRVRQLSQDQPYEAEDVLSLTYPAPLRMNHEKAENLLRYYMDLLRSKENSFRSNREPQVMARVLLLIIKLLSTSINENFLGWTSPNGR